MIVNLDDGSCRTCGCQLVIEEVQDGLMFVRCATCEDAYEVEPDAFGDGCMTYYFPMMTEKLLGPDDGDD